MNGPQPAVKGRKSIRLRDSSRGETPVRVPSSTRRRLLRDDLLMRVKIEGPAGDPARLDEAQRRRIQHITALTKGEMTKEEFLAEENPGVSNLFLQEDIMTDESSQSSEFRVQSSEKAKKKYVRKPKVADVEPAAAATNGHGPAGTVSLTPEQVSKLWEAVTGGKIFIEATGDVTIEVSLESFPKALPVLLDWMSRA